MNATATLAERLRRLEDRLSEACARAGRAREDVTLLAVSKTRSADEIRQLRNLGVTCFGENHLDEASAKQDRLAGTGLEWHFIGPIQSNKTRGLAARFDWVQSVDRLKVLRRLGRQRPEGLPPAEILLQVNIDREPQKAGCDPDELDALVECATGFDTLRLRGLMAIPAAGRPESETRAAFAHMRRLFDRLPRSCGVIDTLSMGMSADLEAAVAEGSTMVRIGTALFGPRRS